MNFKTCFKQQSFEVILLRVALKPIIENPEKSCLEKICNLKNAGALVILITLNLTFTILKFTKKHNKT